MTTPADHPVTKPEANVAQNSSVANTSTFHDNAGGAAAKAGALSNGNIADEKDAPEYAPPGPDDKLSRSYLPVDSKPLARSPRQAADAATEAPLPELSAGTTSQSEVVRSPTSVSIRSGGGHRRGEGSTFANGAAVTGPNSHPEVDESVHDRAAAAETALPAKTKSKLSKAERKDSKRLSKIIKSESKAEKQALAAATKELAELQSQQSQAIKREAKAHTVHTKALALHHKTESKYLLLKAEYEKNQLDMENMEKALENERANARDISDRIAEKAKEVEKLRVTRNTDEREREAKLVELNQRKPSGRFLMRKS